MSLMQNRWFRRLGFGAVAALSLFAVSPASQAQAREYGYRAPVAVHHASFLPRVFFGHGPHWQHRDHYWR